MLEQGAAHTSGAHHLWHQAFQLRCRVSFPRRGLPELSYRFLDQVNSAGLVVERRADKTTLLGEAIALTQRGAALPRILGCNAAPFAFAWRRGLLPTPKPRGADRGSALLWCQRGLRTPSAVWVLALRFPALPLARRMRAPLLPLLPAASLPASDRAARSP
ncbi:hypothetical protein ERJ75_000124100 [Trypanosoma vivax]|nr:hypothetical protein ERJ75_000124100 [Trypanosoma vivax]